MTWAPAYASAAELAHFMAQAQVHDVDDAELSLAVETASRSVDRACNRQFGTLDTAEPRFYTAQFDRHRRRWVIDTDDFATTDDFVVETAALQSYSPITDCLPAPINAVAGGKVWTQVVVNPASTVVPTTAEHGVRVTAKFGWPEVPPSIKLATLIQASRLFSRRKAPFGILGSIETGGELRLLERLDVDLMTSVSPYRKVWGAV